MATYYVKPTGNNASTGTSVGTAWQTINYALSATSGVVAGDTINIAAGVYREVISVGMTTSPSTTNIIGDTDGSIFGTAGEVRLTAFLTDDDTAGSTSDALSMSAKTYLSFRNLRIEGYSGYGVRVQGASTNITFDKCHITSTGSNAALRLDITTGITANHVIKNCILIARANTLQVAPVASSGAIAVNVSISNCFVMASSSACIFLLSSGTTGTLSGFTITNCTTFGGATGINVSTSVYATGAVNITNCLVMGHTTALSANVAGQIIEDYNRLVAFGTARNMIPATGTNTITTGTFGIDLGAGFTTGSSRHLFLQPYVSGVVSGDGTSTGAPVNDIYSYTRPSPPSIGVAENNPISAGSGVVTAPRYTINTGIN
jgi:hypothetical protein